MLYCCLNLCKLKERLMIGFVFSSMYYKMLEFDRPVSECRNFLFWWIDPGKKEHRGLQHHQEEIMKGKKMQF